MIKELHGKHYYIELPSFEDCAEVQKIILTHESLRDENFFVTRSPENKWIIFSERECHNREEGFRGEKYHDWEHVKQQFYKYKIEKIRSRNK